MNIAPQDSSLPEDFLEGEGTFFRTQSITIKENLSPELFKSFCNLSNNEDRIKFIYNLDIVHRTELPKSPFNKNAENVLTLKTQGNNLFGKEDYIQAAKYYSRALIECPQNEDILLSTLYANRSAALYYLKEYSKSLQDIDLALSLPYPKHLTHKVKERKARCHLALNDLNNAIDAFKEALQTISKANLDDKVRQKKESDFSIMIVLLTKTLNESKPKARADTKQKLPAVPEVENGKNRNFLSASNLVRIDSSPSDGRYAVANNDIEPGAVLIVEAAHCASLLFRYCKSHCQECFIRVTHPLPCPNCANVVFCSLKCKSHAMNTYHKYECDVLGSLWASGSSIICNLALRLITQRGLQYFLKRKQNLNKKLADNENYDSSDYRTVYNLCGHQEIRSDVDFFQRSVMAVVLLKFLQKSDFFKTEINKNLSVNELYIGGLLLHNLQILQFNAHEIAELQFDTDYPGEIEKAKSQFIGGGLFPTLALFNHSCEPGIVRYFSGSKVIVRSIKKISANSVIAENYGPIYTEVPKMNRREELKSRYWFDCNCIPCRENWPLFDDMKSDFLPLRCLKNSTCPGVVKVNVNTDEFMFPCPDCGESICIFGSLKALNDTEAMFKKGERYLKNQSFQDAYDTFIKIMKLLNNILKPPYKDFCLCQQKIRSTMLTFGNTFYPIGKQAK